MAGLEADKAAVKYGCEKVIRRISELKPAWLYPYFDRFVEMLYCDNSFLKWGAIITIGNLAAVDADHKIEKIFDIFFSPIPGPVLITAANTIGAAANIVLAKPVLADKIAHEILKVEKAHYKTSECRNVAIGHAINTFDKIFNLIQDKEPVITFTRKQGQNTRPAVKKKAEKFLKKYQL